MSLSSAEVIALLDVQEPLEVAWTSKDGTLRGDCGEPIDKRTIVPWVMALGPFGCWPVTLRVAEETIREHKDWHEAESLQLGPVVCWRRGWGFSSKPANSAQEVTK